MNKLTILSLIILMTLPMIWAEQTVKTITHPLGYSPLPQANTIQYYNLSVDYPDGIEEIISLEVIVKGDYSQGTTTRGGFINPTTGQVTYCTPSEWTNHVTTANYEMSFDCTEKIHQTNWKGGNVIFAISSSLVSANVKPYAVVTYLNRPSVTAKVHGTEYESGDNGKIFLQLLNEFNQPIKNASCYSSIYYPNNNVWKYQQLMSYVSEGIYVYDFITPYQQGVYPVSAFCTLPTFYSPYYLVSDDFNSGSASGGIGWSGSWSIPTGCYYEATNKYEGAYSVECYNDRTFTRNILSNDSYSSLDYSFYWRLDSIESGEHVYYRMSDASGAVFTLLDVTDGNDDGAFHQATGSLSILGDSFDFDGTISFYMTTSNNLENDDYYNIDYLNITLNAESPTENETEYQIVRGTGEVHVGSTNGEYIISMELGEIRNDSLLDSASFYYQVISQTAYNKTNQPIGLELWSPFPCDNVNYVYDLLPNGSLQEYEFTTSKESERCVVHIDHPLDVGQTYNLKVVVDNYWKFRLINDFSTMKLQEEMINISCQNYVLANSLQPLDPSKNTSGYNASDPLWSSCNSYLKSSKEYSDIASQFFGIINIPINFTYEQMAPLEAKWDQLSSVKIKIDSYSNTIFNGLNLGNSYSLALLNDPYPPENPLYSQYFASISSSYLNYLAIQSTGQINTTEIASGVWEFNNRTLSDFEFEITTSINATEVADAVWQYSGTIQNNILSQIAGYIWDWASSINTNILELFSNKTWEHEGRYTHGVILE